MLSRIRAPFKKQQENPDTKYLRFTRSCYNKENYEENEGSDRDDTSSILSFSTNATMDNIPGTGRTIDTFFYQPLGRKVERLMFRMSMTSLPPDRIVQYLWKDSEGSVYTVGHKSVSHMMQVISEREKVAGLKSLVKQTQSNSLYRCAAALSALICLSMSSLEYGYFYVSVAAVEPIFHLESLANALDDSNSEKNYFLFLIGLARARLHFTNLGAHEIIGKFAYRCRRKLLEILDLSRSPSHNPFVAFIDACVLFAKSISFAYTLDISSYGRSFAPTAHSVIETTYFLLIFLVRSLIDQYHTKHNIHPLQRLVLSTFCRWLEGAMAIITFWSPDNLDLAWQMPICAFRIVYFTIDNMRLGDLFPQLISHRKHQKIIPLAMFPRRNRNSTPQIDNPINLQSYLSICTIRTRRLLISPDELRREAADSAKLKHSWISDGLYDPPFEEKSDEEWQRSLDRALTIPVVENNLTREFLSARDSPHWYSNEHWYWKKYKKTQRQRHRMGEYCRSNLDWGWDSSSCLERLFRIDTLMVSPRSEGRAAFPATIYRGSNKDILDVIILEKGPNLLKTIRVQYETEMGEVKFRMFYAAQSAEDEGDTPGDCAGALAGSWKVAAQETGEHRTSHVMEKDR